MNSYSNENGYNRIILKLEGTSGMTRRTRLILLLAGLVLVLLAIAALWFALQPDSVLRETIRLSPTLFEPPGGQP